MKSKGKSIFVLTHKLFSTESVFWVNTCTHTHSKGSHPTVLQWPRKAKGGCAPTAELCTPEGGTEHQHPQSCARSHKHPWVPLKHWEGTATCQHPDLSSQTIWWAPSKPTSPLLHCGAQREKKTVLAREWIQLHQRKTLKWAHCKAVVQISLIGFNCQKKETIWVYCYTRRVLVREVWNGAATDTSFYLHCKIV